jgi:hypothetical protein
MVCFLLLNLLYSKEHLKIMKITTIPLPLDGCIEWGRGRVGVNKMDYPLTLILPRKGGGNVFGLFSM